VAIPAIGLSARIVPVGLTVGGHMDLPSPSVAGWYRWGTTPGAAGPSVLVGHVDSIHGPAVFYRLSAARTGEKVRVTRADGSATTFTITKVTVVSKTHFPSRAVFGPTRQAAIRLITCAGPFAAGTGYADSLIIWGNDNPA
jgi:sortase (surface protein transpeptidase)